MIDSSKFSATIEERSQPYMSVRRALFFTLVICTTLYLIKTFAQIVSINGFGFFGVIMTILFSIGLPWTVIGFWNSIIGFIVMRTSEDPVAAVTPGVSVIQTDAVIAYSTAIITCIRNEEVETTFRNVSQMARGLAATSTAGHFHFYILSDTTDVLIAQAEEQAVATLQHELQDRLAITYRLRENNTGFKAGNIRDFCDRWGMNHDFMITLDADSYMSTSAIMNLVLMMQTEPRLGIVQHLTIGLPSTSAFTRIFQFGMRLGMRSYTMGSAWWQGECGPYWGHNAIIRLAPFIAHCQLPELSGTGALSGSILSHDQLEAVMIRKAGYECRVLPLENGSYEENPPSLTEFIRRDLRWCHGNMQYLKLLGLKGTKPISKYQLYFAIFMFIGSPAAMLFGLIAAIRLILHPIISPDSIPAFDAAGATSLVFIYLIMSFAPKLVTLADVLMHKETRLRFGGGIRVTISAIIETVFSFIIVPIMTVSEGIFLIELAFGKIMGWSTQQRGEYQISLNEAVQRLLPHTLIGISMALVFGFIDIKAFWWTLPITLGLILSIPFAIVTTIPTFGKFLLHFGLCRLPEETNPPEDLKTLGNTAIDYSLRHPQILKLAKKVDDKYAS